MSPAVMSGAGECSGMRTLCEVASWPGARRANNSAEMFRSRPASRANRLGNVLAHWLSGRPRVVSCPVVAAATVIGRASCEPCTRHQDVHVISALLHPSTGARASPPTVAPHPRSEEAKMAELHYMEMGWSGSGWMDPLPMETPPAPAPPPAATPAPAAQPRGPGPPRSPRQPPNPRVRQAAPRPVRRRPRRAAGRPPSGPRRRRCGRRRCARRRRGRAPGRGRQEGGQARRQEECTASRQEGREAARKEVEQAPPALNRSAATPSTACAPARPRS